MSARALTRSYAALWLATIAGALLAALGAKLAHVDAPHAPGLDPTLTTFGELATHNTLVALWPLALIAIGWPALAGARRVGDAAIAAQLLAHGLVVGSALGQQPQLWRYLPHLPIEWLAIAIPAAAWLTARRSARPGHPTTTSTNAVLLAIAALAAVAGAAAIETYLVPVS